MPESIDVRKLQLFKDLVLYSKLDPILVLERMKYADKELAVLWHNKNSVKEYYTSTDLYIYDLTRYQIFLDMKGLLNSMQAQLKEIGAKKILEFGGGIGEFSIRCAKNELDITYHDLDGPTKDYALWRFEKHSADVKIGSETDLDKKWDLVNIMDVLEHIENPRPIIEKLSKNAKYIFCNPTEVKYNVFYPQHISKVDLDGKFEHVKEYLYRSVNSS